MNPSDQAAKWDKRHAAGADRVQVPARVLTDFRHLLPGTGRALDLACGNGENALLLAVHGLETCAWDISGVALKSLAARAAALGLPVETAQRDVVAQPPPPASFDVIVVAHFLDRSLAPHLCRALRPSGLLFYQTFLLEHRGTGGPANPAYRLGANELLGLFADLHVLAYREEGLVGDPARGLRGEALLVAQRRDGA